MKYVSATDILSDFKKTVDSHFVNSLRESRGFSDFNYTRNRILWATRDNPSVRGIPKPKDEIKKNKGKKRGPYNKKK